MPAPGVATIAGGDITEKRFVKLNGTDNTVVQAGAGEHVFGVAGQGTRNAPYSTLNDGFIAISGEPVKVFGTGEICPLVVGAAVNAGDRLKSDANGKGIPVAAALDEFGAVALQDGGADGVEILVRVEPGIW